MMSRLTPEQQRKLAIGLMVLLALAIGWRLGGSSLSRWLSSDSEAVEREARRNFLAGIEVVDLRLDALEGEPATYTPDRDLFRYPPPPKPATPPPKPPKEQSVPTVPPPPYVAPKPVPPPVPYELLGIFGPERRRIAAFKEGEEIVNALEHETLKEKFIVHDIGLNTVEFHFVGFPDSESKTLIVEPERR